MQNENKINEKENQYQHYNKDNSFFKNSSDKNQLSNNCIINYNLNNITFNYNYNNNISNEKLEIYNIIYMLNNNKNIYSYLYSIDYLSLEELSLLFAYILNNQDFIISNSQSYLLIDKIISLLNFKNKSKENQEKYNDIIYSFLATFFHKNLRSIIYSNNYITSVINFMEKVGEPRNNFIYNEIKSNFRMYAYNRQGCILIQNLFPFGNEIQKQILLNLIFEQYNELIIDRYGHYLFKYLLYQAENGEKYYPIIFNKVIKDIKKFANNQYSSAVVERLLDSINPIIKNTIIEILCRNESDIVELIYNDYGNYVLQKIINVTKDNNILGLIYKTIMKKKNTLLKISYGKKIIKKINSVYTLK